MSIDAIIMAILSYGFFVGGFVYGLIKVLQSDRNKKKVSPKRLIKGKKDLKWYQKEFKDW